MPTLGELHKRLEELEAEIAEAQQRLPAHSVKPAVMHMLLDLEDEYDTIMQQIARLKKTGNADANADD
jgi:hypothetical protein